MSPAGPRIREALAALERKGSRKVPDQMRNQFGITADKAFGAKMGDIQALEPAQG